MSKADLASFCLEVSKQLDMRYIPPAFPIDLNLKERGGLDHRKGTTSQLESQPGNKESPVLSSQNPDVRAIAALFDRSQD